MNTQAAPIVTTQAPTTPETKAPDPKAPVVETEAAPEPSGLDKAASAAQRARKAASSQRKAREAAQLSAYQATVAQAENQRLREEVAATRAQQEAFRQDPYKALRDAGLTDTQIAARVAKDGTIESVVEKLQAQLTSEAAARKALEDSIKAEKTAVAEREAEQNYLKLANDVKVYPNLAKLPDTFILDLTRNLISQLANRTNSQTGRPANEGVSFKQIAEYLELQCRKKGKALEGATADEIVAPPEESEATSEVVVKSGTPEPKKTVPAAKKSTTTLTQKLSSQKFSLPENYDKLPEHQQRKILADQLRASGAAK